MKPTKKKLAKPKHVCGNTLDNTDPCDQLFRDIFAITPGLKRAYISDLRKEGIPLHQIKHELISMGIK